MEESKQMPNDDPRVLDEGTSESEAVETEVLESAEDSPEAADSRARDPGGAAVAESEIRDEELAYAQAENDILRGELAMIQERLADLEQQLEEVKGKYLRARADLDNLRRRAAQDAERARESGLDSAVIPVLTVFDDLTRALAIADEKDPSKIIPGVRAVRDGLERSLEVLGIYKVGANGEVFDPDVHEALASSPSDDDAQVGTIAEVYQVGFRRGERLIRPARVVVYQD